jgi:hypothetical protein
MTVFCFQGSSHYSSFKCKACKTFLFILMTGNDFDLSLKNAVDGYGLKNIIDAAVF